MAWNSRVDHVAPFRVMHLLEMAQAREAAGHDVIHLEVGEPDFATPAPIVAAGQQALAEGKRATPLQPVWRRYVKPSLGTMPNTSMPRWTLRVFWSHPALLARCCWLANCWSNAATGY